jgi:putative spermidine/putrescine transport system permease protein
MVIIMYLLYIFLPIVLLIIGSFGDNWTNTMLPTGASLRWYEQLWGDPSFRRAFVMSLEVAVLTCVLVVVIALPMAYALTRNMGRFAALFSRLVTSLPIAAPPVVLAFGYIILFSNESLPYLVGTTPLLVAAHVVAALPYMFQTLVADIRHLKLDAIELAAESLGASFRQRFFDIVLPSLRHSILSGVVVVSAISIGEFQVTNLIAGFLNRTYPVVLLQAFYGATGFACASTVLLLLLAGLASLFGALTARAASRTRGGR